jgi:hypothetical protein
MHFPFNSPELAVSLCNNPDFLPVLVGSTLGAAYSQFPVEDLQSNLWPDSLPIDPEWVSCLRVAVDRVGTGKPLKPVGSSWLALAVVAGCLYCGDLDSLQCLFTSDASAESELSVYHAATMAAASLVALASDGAAPDTWLHRVYAFVDGQSDALDLTLLRIGHVLGWTSIDLAMKHISRAGSPDEVVALALYSALCSPSDILSGVSRLSRIPTAASLAGAVLGAHLGWAGFPADWRSRCTDPAVLDDLASRITEAQSTWGATLDHDSPSLS